MEREEAIEVYHGLINTKIKEAFEFFAPELRESEDERIRKALVSLVEELQRSDKSFSGVALADMLAWLEKQEEASKAIEAVDRIDKYIDDHLANAHDMKDSNPDKKYYRGWDDALGKMAGILQDVYSEKENKFAPRVLPCSAAWFEDGEEKQKEQKPVKEQFPPLEGLDAIKAEYYDKGFKNGFDEGVDSVKPAWSEEDYDKLNEM